MVKISLSASKVLAGISLFCVNALAQSIDLDSSNIETYFDSKDKYFVLKEEYRKENLNINLREEQDNLYIDMGSNKLDIKAPVMITSMYDSSFSAREITLENILLQYSQANSINGNVNFKGEGDFTSMKQGNIIDLYENLEGSNPSLTINGNLNSEDLQISLYDTKGSIIVNGEANFNSNLEIEYENEELLKEDLILINATKGLNVDLSRVSLTNYGYYKEFYSIERLESSFSARIPTHYSLKLTNNQLILSPNFEFYLDSKNNKQILEDKITSLTNMKEILEDLLNWTSINEAEKTIYKKP
ncbi:hypothetical protein [Campylobacter sp. CCS1377]|uniref:Uncharacterized protein n=1 Tax=Campylobacter sp. CCS1377 TaxID=3158229 RepID=A0AAU7E8V2_9BACT|nr:hypothetical protein [Campylobacter jejuni]